MNKAVVVKNVASLMLEPRQDSPVADEVLHGMVLRVGQQENGEWQYAETHYGYQGYIREEAILVDETLSNLWEKKRPYVIIHPFADVLAEPKYASRTLLTLTKGGGLLETGIYEDKWEKVLLPDETVGWIRKGVAAQIERLPIKTQEDLLRSRIVETAMGYMGTQYRWGGKSPLGIDCSGLVSMAYMLNGYLIPRDADIQQQYLRPIERAQAKAGDLFFFPGHVALCIEEDRYIHATGREGWVLVNSFNPQHKDYREDLDKACCGTGTLFGMEV